MKTFLKKTWFFYVGFIGVFCLYFILLNLNHFATGPKLIDFLFAIIVVVFSKRIFGSIFKDLRKEDCRVSTLKSIGITMSCLALIFVVSMLIRLIYNANNVDFISVENIRTHFIDIAFTFTALYVFISELMYVKRDMIFSVYFILLGLIFISVGILQFLGFNILIGVGCYRFMIIGNIFIAMGAIFKFVKDALNNGKEKNEKLMEIANNLNQRNID